MNNYNQKQGEKEVSFTGTEIVTARSLTFISFFFNEELYIKDVKCSFCIKMAEKDSTVVLYMSVPRETCHCASQRFYLGHLLLELLSEVEVGE